MKVKPTISSNKSDKPKAISQEELKAKIKAKFGDKALAKNPKPKVEDKAELKTKGGVTNSNEKNFGDISSNDPNSQLTHDKLKDILKSGAFHFNDKERATLAKILK